MLKMLFLVLAAGLAGLAAASVVLSLLVPLAGLALKIIVVLAVGYLVLRLVCPEVAERVRSRVGDDAR